MRPVICLVTDRHRFGGTWPDRLVEYVRQAAEGGVHLVQVRERDLAGRELQRLVSRCVDAVHGTRTRLIVNDRLDVALAAGAHGVHLPASGIPADRIRLTVPAGFIIGQSVHTAQEAASIAKRRGVDYLIFGTVFPSASKPDGPIAGLDALRAAAAAVPVPMLAIGGVTLDRLAAIATSGASGFAAVGMFADAARALRLPQLVAEASHAFDTLKGVP